jgi:hypothetical protein
MEQSSVSRRKRIALKFILGDPSQVVASNGLRLTGQTTASKEPKMHGLFGISVSQRFQAFLDLDLDPKFLEQFPPQTGLEVLARFPLAPWKLP